MKQEIGNPSRWAEFIEVNFWLGSPEGWGRPCAKANAIKPIDLNRDLANQELEVGVKEEVG